MDVSVKPPVFTGIPVVDADTHLAESYDLWTSRAPAKYKDRVPQVKEDKDGVLAWFLDGDIRLGAAHPICTIKKDGTKIYGMDLVNYKFDEVYEGAHNAKARLAYMDSAGITAQVIYPNLLGFGNQKGLGADVELRNAVTHIFNDAMAEFQEEAGNRILPMAMMPWWDMDLALKEARRCFDMGLRGINTHAAPENNGLPPLGDKHWAPLWDLVSEAEAPVNFHIGGGFDSHDWFGTGGWPSQKPTERLAYGSTLLYFANCQLFTNIFISQFLEDFPKLKLVSVESGVGWIPFILESVTYQMNEARMKMKMTPKEIFQRQIFACSWFERDNLVVDARRIGTDNVMFQTDFPHPVCLYPDALGYMEHAASEFTDEERRKVFGGNAAKLYKIDFDKIDTV